MSVDPIKKVGSYLLLKELGRGVTATVYLGANIQTHRLVAVKVIPNERLLNLVAAKQFKSEYQLLRKLNNEHIINVLDLITSRTNRYLIVDYCNGGTLLSYRIKYKEKNHCEMNEVFIQKIIRQFIVGLEYMHSNSVIHRDIKLENIFLHFDDCPNEYAEGKPCPRVNFNSVSLNDNFTLKIGDLGLAKVLNDGISSTMCGTPLTMSPEVMMNDGAYDTKADLWSLGVITYELLTGALPFDASSQEQLMILVAKGTYCFPKELKASDEIISFISGLLQSDPEKRMNWAQIKQHPFIVKAVKDFQFRDLEEPVRVNTKTEDEWFNVDQQTKYSFNVEEIHTQYTVIENYY